MKNKIIGILVCTLLIAAAVLPVVGTISIGEIQMVGIDKNALLVVTYIGDDPTYPATILRGGTNYTITVGMKIIDGDILQTNTQRVEIIDKNGLWIRIGYYTEIKVYEVDYTEEGYLLIVHEGEIYAKPSCIKVNCRHIPTHVEHSILVSMNQTKNLGQIDVVVGPIMVGTYDIFGVFHNIYDVPEGCYLRIIGVEPNQTYELGEIPQERLEYIAVKYGEDSRWTTFPLKWTQVNIDGFGDPNNSACCANWPRPIKEWPHDYCYSGTWNGVTGGEVWRSADGTTWTQVNIDGFGDPNNIATYPTVDFDSKLYVGVLNEVTGAEIWRSADGTTWTQVNIDGFGCPDNVEAYAEVVFQDNLYAGTGNEVTGAEVWRSSDGTTWTQVNIDGFGDSSNVYTELPVVFDGYLYAGTYNEVTGAEVWRSADGITWTQVNIDGFGDPNNVETYPYSILDGHLYTGTTNEATGGEIWRSADGITWTQVNIDGFGDPNNVETSPFLAFDGYVYVGTTNEVTGAEVWRSSDGTTWTQVNIDGFGDPNTLSASPYSIFDGNLYAGSWNEATGCEVWRGVPVANNPPNKPSINGPSNGKAGTSYTYTFTSTDPEGDDVSYYIKWGDGGTTTWTAFQASDTSYSVSHTWTAQDTYTIEAKAKDTYGAESDWATLSVSMPKNKVINRPFLSFLENHPNLFPMLQHILQPV